MSKASEWHQHLEAYIEEHRPEIHDPDDEHGEQVLASVDDYGDMEIEHHGHWSKTRAIALARWILDTFGEPEIATEGRAR